MVLGAIGMSATEKSTLTFAGHAAQNETHINFVGIERILNANQIVTFIAQTTPDNLLRLAQLVSAHERERAEKFRKVQDRNLSLISHGLKRLVLSQLLKLEPTSLVFDKTIKGKPFCSNNDKYRFSLSHSGEWAALSVALKHEIGVDIEFAKDQEYLEIADFCFTQKELGQFIESNFDNLFFLKTWTQKESITKATGDGLFLKFSNIDIHQCESSESTVIEGIKYYVYSEAFYDGFISVAFNRPLTSLNIFII